jgi:hypothetical protein
VVGFIMQGVAAPKYIVESGSIRCSFANRGTSRPTARKKVEEIRKLGFSSPTR